LRERESNSPWLAYETCLITGSPATKKRFTPPSANRPL